MVLQYACPVGLSRPGESAVWRSLNYEEAIAPQPPPPPPSSSYPTSLDLTEPASVYDEKTSFKGDPPDYRDTKSWWGSAYGVFRVGLERAKETRGRGGKISPRCMGARARPEKNKTFEYWTFEEADEKVRLLGSGLTQLLRKEGVITLESFPDEVRNGGKFANVGILLQSRREWIISDLALSAYPPLTSVTIHYTFPLDHMIAILQETKVSFLITDVGQLENMKSVEATLHPQLKGVMLVDMYDELKRLDEENKPEEKAKVVKLIECLRDKNIQVCDFEDVIEKGRKAYIPPFMHQDPERIFTLVYTSGTTGNPKGVMLSNRNFVRELQGCLRINSYTLMLGNDFLHFALLPLSHVFERMVEYVAYGHGAAVAYFSRKKELLVDDLKYSHPSCMIMVPRVAVLILDSIESQIQNLPFYKRSLINFALNRKLQARRAFVNQQAVLSSQSSFTNSEENPENTQRTDARVLLPPKIHTATSSASSSSSSSSSLLNPNAKEESHKNSIDTPSKCGVSSPCSTSPSKKTQTAFLSVSSSQKPSSSHYESSSSFLVSKISAILSPFSSSASSSSSSSSTAIDANLFYRHTPPLKGIWYDRVLAASTILQTRLFGEPGCVKFLLSGGGKLNPIVQEKLEAYLSTSFIQGWGMTETCGAGCWQARLGDGMLDNAGGPNPVLEMKLKSWEQYNAEKSELPQGELLLRGESIFEGYFRQPEMTKEVFLFDDDDDEDVDYEPADVGRSKKEETSQDEDKRKGAGEWRKRWLCTGDIVEIQPNGSIKIIDRKKSLIKLAQGEYLQTEKLEGIYGGSVYIDNIFVHGYDYESYPVAVIVPNRKAVYRWYCSEQKKKKAGSKGEGEDNTEGRAGGGGGGAEEEGTDQQSPSSKEEGQRGGGSQDSSGGVTREEGRLSDEAFSDLLRNAELKREILRDMLRLGNEAHVLGFEKVKNIHLTSDVWTPENAMLTPTFKIKRPVLLRAYKSDIDRLYTELREANHREAQEK